MCICFDIIEFITFKRNLFSVLECVKTKKNIATFYLNGQLKTIFSYRKYYLGQNNCRLLAGFGTSFFHHKWNGTRLLSPESKCTSCATGCQTT